jgi:hypothetical protein
MCQTFSCLVSKFYVYSVRRPANQYGDFWLRCDDFVMTAELHIREVLRDIVGDILRLKGIFQGMIAEQNSFQFEVCSGF